MVGFFAKQSLVRAYARVRIATIIHICCYCSFIKIIEKVLRFHFPGQVDLHRKVSYVSLAVYYKRNTGSQIQIKWYTCKSMLIHVSHARTIPVYIISILSTIIIFIVRGHDFSTCQCNCHDELVVSGAKWPGPAHCRPGPAHCNFQQFMILIHDYEVVSTVKI